MASDIQWGLLIMSHSSIGMTASLPVRMAGILYMFDPGVVVPCMLSVGINFLEEWRVRSDSGAEIAADTCLCDCLRINRAKHAVTTHEANDMCISVTYSVCRV